MSWSKESMSRSLKTMSRLMSAEGEWRMAKLSRTNGAGMSRLVRAQGDGRWAKSSRTKGAGILCPQERIRAWSGGSSAN